MQSYCIFFYPYLKNKSRVYHHIQTYMVKIKCSKMGKNEMLKSTTKLLINKNVHN